MLGIDEEADLLKLEKLNKLFQEKNDLTERQKTFWEVMKRERLNLKEFMSLLQYLQPDEQNYKG